MAAGDTRRLRVVVTGDSEDAQQALEQVGDSADQSESKLMMLTRTLGAFAAKGAVLLGAVGAAAVTMGVSTAAQLEQVEVGFTTMLGSAEKAKKFMKQLQDFAAATPFEFTELTGAAQQFLAMGFAAKDVIPMLRAVGDAVAAMGGSAENVDSVTRALGQMQAKGKVSGEELMQLTEQGIPALKILADSYGVSTSEMSKMVEQGKVMSDKAIPALIKGLSEGTEHVKGFGGMMDKQSETMNGKWSTFMDTLKMGLGNIAKNILPQMKTAIDTLSTGMANFFAGLEGKGKLKGFTGTLNEIGLGIRGFFLALKEGDVTSDGLVGKFETIGATIHGMADAFKSGKVESEGLRGTLEGLAITVHTVIDMVAWLATETANLVSWLWKHDDVAKALTVTMGGLLAITKAHAIATGVQAAGGLMAMFKNLTLVQGIMRTVTALQWAYNGAVAAANYTQIAGYLAAIAVQQKIMAAWTKIVTAAQWLWNIALNANPIGLIIAAIAAVVVAIVLLWKHNEGFRKFVLNVLWPAVKKVFEAIKNLVMIVVRALVVAFNWAKDKILVVWEEISSFLGPIIAKIVQVMTPIMSVIFKIQKIFLAFYVNVWKMIWIAIQIAVKLFIAYFVNIWWPLAKFVFNAIASAVKFLWNVFKANFELIKLAVSKFVDWLTNTAWPFIKKIWDAIVRANGILRDAFFKVFNAIKDKVLTVFNAIAGPIFAVLSRAINTLRGWINNLRTLWNAVFDGVKKKAGDTMDAVARAFNKGKDGIKAAWDKIVSVTKTPINFVIQDVYNDRIRSLWNKVAEKFGIKTRLDTIPKLARGGVIGQGYGTKDDQLALLMRGEGVLTTREMRRLGGPRGFHQFREALAQYGNGGVVGGMMGDGPGSWFKSLASKGKDIFQGIAGAAIKPLVNTIRNFINGGLPSSGFGGLLRGGANTILSNLVSWVTGKDKEIGSIGGNGGAIGYKAMQALIRNVFPSLNMISGYRPGARTLSGNLSYHGFGRAVDYPPVRALALWIRNNFGAKTKELITPWNELNLHNGRAHRYTGAVWNQHNFAGGNAHVHWAMDGASVVDPGWFMGYNGTGKPETLVNADKFAGVRIETLNLIVQGTGYTDQDIKKIRNELINLSKRNGGNSRLP